MIKLEKTNLRKLGVKYPSQSEDVKNKFKETMLLRYNIDNPLKDINTHQKAIELSKSKLSKEKRENTNLEKYGFKNVSKNEEICAF